MRYKQELLLRNSDYDQYDHLKPYVYFSLFQDIAARQTNYYHIGYLDSKEKNIAWILMKNVLTIENQVDVDTPLILETWPSGKGRMDFKRDYLLKTKDDKVVARGTSQWVITTFDTHKLLRSSEVSFPDELEEESQYSDIVRLKDADINELKHLNDYQITIDDIDHYGHTNNARYAYFIYLALNLKKEEEIANLQIDYHHEAKLNETISIYFKQENNKISGCGIIKETNIRSFNFEIELK